MWALRAMDAAGCEYARNVSDDTWTVYYKGHEVGKITRRAMRMDGDAFYAEVRGLYELVESMKAIEKALS